MSEANGNGRRSLALDEARAKTPPVNAVEAMRSQLAVAVFGAVKEKDVEAMVSKLKSMALEGDHKAMKMYFELIGVMGKQQQPPPPAEPGVARQIVEALQDMVDEIRITRHIEEERQARLPLTSDNLD